MKCRGFSLMELSVSIALMAIFAWMMVNGAQQAKKNAAIAKTRTMMANLETAIRIYEIDMGITPGSDNRTMVEALTVNPSDSDWKGPYIKIKQKGLNENREYVDAWGNAFIYINPGQNNADSYDLYSKGPDGKGDGNDKNELRNW